MSAKATVIMADGTAVQFKSELPFASPAIDDLKAQILEHLGTTFVQYNEIQIRVTRSRGNILETLSAIAVVQTGG